MKKPEIPSDDRDNETAVIVGNSSIFRYHLHHPPMYVQHYFHKVPIQVLMNRTKE